MKPLKYLTELTCYKVDKTVIFLFQSYSVGILFFKVGMSPLNANQNMHFLTVVDLL